MSYHRVTLAIIGLSMFVVFGRWPGPAAAEVNVDIGPVHVHTGQPAPPRPAGMDVLTRGPVNEAFAQPVTFDQGAGFVIKHAPPAPINEIAPEQKPEGDNVLWIPGYWSWDNDSNNFLWVSGCWRAVPPGTSWVPGYWAAVRGGYQWVAGFWTTADTREIEYLPAPPASLDEGPQGQAPADSIWIPGCWLRQEARYAWRPGFWERARPNWVWMPAHYVCAPSGCIFVDGYWDYPLDRCGVAFLPVSCPQSLYGQAGFEFCPSICLDLGVLMDNLFCCPSRCSYYFGDYYGSRYSREGFHPWYEASSRHDWYDPVFAHEQWQHRDDHNWLENQRVAYENRSRDKSLRPARTYDALQAQTARLPESERSHLQLGRPLNEVASARGAPFKFNTLDSGTRDATASRSRDLHAYRTQRSQWESPSAALSTGSDHHTAATPRSSDFESRRIKAGTSPIRVAGSPRKEMMPPERPVHPKVDMNAKPRSR
jgi:hypothetical protein